MELPNAAGAAGPKPANGRRNRGEGSMSMLQGMVPCAVKPAQPLVRLHTMVGKACLLFDSG